MFFHVFNASIRPGLSQGQVAHGDPQRAAQSGGVQVSGDRREPAEGATKPDFVTKNPWDFWIF